MPQVPESPSDEVREALRRAARALESGRAEEAVGLLRGAVSAAPGSGAAWLALGAALRRCGSGAEAVDALERGRALAPSDPRGPHQLGLMYLEQGLMDAAVASLGEAARLAPERPELLADLGLARQTAGDLEAAESAYRAALESAPGYPPALAGIARLAEIRRDPGPALALLEQVVAADEADPGLVAACAGLMDLAGRPEEAIGLLRRALARAGEREGRMQLLFRLAALLDARGEYAEAFAAAAEANRLKGARFDPVAYRALADRLVSAFDARTMAALPVSRRRDERPVFIVGMPRSGTSLVEQILASHPAAHGAGELAEIGLLALATAQDGRDYPESVAALDREQLETLAGAYLERLERLAPGAQRVVDKMWQNFEFLGFAAMLCPGARVIHCVRDPMDVGLSCYFQHFFGEGVAFAYDLGHIGTYHREYQRIMEHWRRVLSLPILDVPYERLVAEPEDWIRRVVGFAGLDWDPACLDFHRTERVVRTASHAQVRRPMYASSVGRHRHYARWLGPLRQALGPAAGGDTRPAE